MAVGHCNHLKPVKVIDDDISKDNIGVPNLSVDSDARANQVIKPVGAWIEMELYVQCFLEMCTSDRAMEPGVRLYGEWVGRDRYYTG